MSQIKWSHLLFAACAALPFAAQADDAPPNYLGGMFSYKLPDNHTGAEAGYGAHVLYGSPMNDWLSLELNGFGHALTAAQGFTGEADAYGVGMDLRGIFAKLPFAQFFGIGGLGAAYLDNGNTGNKSVAPFLNVGAGAIAPLSSNFNLRAEARYYMTSASGLGLGTNFLNDGHFNIGVEYSFDGLNPEKPLPPPTPEPVQVVPPDQDHDGVADSVDACPDTPAGTVVDEKGCPLPPPPPPAAPVDSDGDGVTDDLDKCPHTPKGMKVDASGCVIQQVIVLYSITFATGSGELTGDSKRILDEMAEGMKGQPNMLIEVDGHTDSVGSQKSNLKLSKLRAQMVKEYLASKGIAPERMTTDGFGQFKPIATNKTAEGRAQNRRVEFKVKQQAQ